MQLPVLVEPLPDRTGFRARMGEPFNLSIEASTAEEALRQLDAEFQRRLGQGARLAAISASPVPSSPPPGWLPDDDLTREWRDAVDAYRAACDAADRLRILGEQPDEKVAS